MPRFAQIFIYGTVGLAFLLILVSQFYMLYPFQVLEMQQPYVLTTKDLHAGDEFSYAVVYCKHTDKRADTSRFLLGEDGSKYPIVVPAAVLPQGCGTATSTGKLPLDMVSQNYHIHVVVKYTFPFGRIVEKEFRSEEFFVKPVVIPVIPL